MLRRLSEADITFLWKSYLSNFMNFEIPPGVYELSEINFPLTHNLITIKADKITMDANLKLNVILQFYTESFFHVLSGFA